MIDFQCPHCARHLKVPESYLGSSGNCAHCGAPVTIWVAPPSLHEEQIKPQQPVAETHTSHYEPGGSSGSDISNISVTRDIEALHFTLEKMIEIYRGKEKTDSWAYSAALQAAHNQIAIAPFVKRHLESAYKRPLPQHLGYMLLADVLENQRIYDKCIKLCRNAKQQGWAGDWVARIRRCENMLASPLPR